MTLRNWQKLIKDTNEIIVQASAKDGSDSWQNFPIGMSWQYVVCYKNINNKTLQIGSHNKTVLCAINIHTDERRRFNNKINRKNIIKTLENNLIYNNLINFTDYFINLPNYKFIISPEGNGIDCHRHYEALLAGCIPIIEYNDKIEEKYHGCPILYTTDYSEITEEYLNKKYLEMLDTEYNFEKLYLSYYSENQIKEIKDCGNCWIQRILSTNWY